ncbi:MAG: YggS family pyridoxal phosphate-dependent enzyme [Bacteroidales bacterium]|nr:YggS family pyridoxal phosphate-dependent enzyme [Bacteroidales bacterium]
MNTIQHNIEQLIKNIPTNVKIIAVSKTKPIEAINEAIKAGQFYFGENKVQELVQKAQAIMHDKIEWHMVGHLQTNKVKLLLPHVTLIHSVDSLKLAKEINKEAQKLNKIIPCLLQIYIAQEDTKFGLSELELFNLLQSNEFQSFKNIRVLGLMGIASNTDDTKIIENEFKYLRKLFEKLKHHNSLLNCDFKELSMGMSGDYKIAIEQGSTMVRIGSAIFGERQYANKN